MSKPTKYGEHNGRIERNPGKLMFRAKGSFRTEAGARAYQKILKEKGLKTKVTHFPGEYYPYILYVIAKHDFWKRDYIIGK